MLRLPAAKRADWDQYLRDVYGERAPRAQSTALADKAFFYCVCSLLRLRTSPRLDLGYGSTWVAGPPTRQTNWTVGNISRANGKGEIELTQHVHAHVQDVS